MFIGINNNNSDSISPSRGGENSGAGASGIRNEILCSLKVYSLKNIKYKGENSNIKMEKSDRHHHK